MKADQSTSTFSEDSLAYIRRYYGVPANVGQRVIADGEPGVIVGGKNQYLLIDLDSGREQITGVWHPTWHMAYLGEDGETIIAGEE